jgi:hypothetical protein
VASTDNHLHRQKRIRQSSVIKSAIKRTFRKTGLFLRMYKMLEPLQEVNIYQLTRWVTEPSSRHQSCTCKQCMFVCRFFKWAEFVSKLYTSPFDTAHRSPASLPFCPFWVLFKVTFHDHQGMPSGVEILYTVHNMSMPANTARTIIKARIPGSFLSRAC